MQTQGVDVLKRLVFCITVKYITLLDKHRNKNKTVVSKISRTSCYIL